MKFKNGDKVVVDKSLCPDYIYEEGIFTIKGLDKHYLITDEIPWYDLGSIHIQEDWLRLATKLDLALL